MDALKRRYVIAGCGPGSRLHLTMAVVDAVEQAQLLAGAQRLLELFPAAAAKRLPFEGSADTWLERLAAQPEGPIVVLVSGDPGVSSLAARILRRFGRENCRLLPGVSSVQFACGRLGLPWENAAIVSWHASLSELLPTSLSGRDPWVILMGARGAEVLAANLAANPGDGEARSCYVCEDLSLPTERVERSSPQQLAQLSPHPRRIVVLSRESLNE